MKMPHAQTLDVAALFACFFNVAPGFHRLRLVVDVVLKVEDAVIGIECVAEALSWSTREGCIRRPVVVRV